MKLSYAPPFILVSALALVGCASAASSSPGGPPPPTGTPTAAAAAAATPSSTVFTAAPTSTPSASATACTSHACVVQLLEQNLTGLVAEDEAVSTKVTCYVSTVVFYASADTYSASCNVTYSDGSSASGTGNYLV